MSKAKIVKQTRHGQITLPKEIRDEINLAPDDLLSITAKDGSISIVPMRASEKSGSGWARELYEIFEPVRAELARYSEQEINDAIDDAIRAARRERRKT